MDFKKQGRGSLLNWLIRLDDLLAPVVQVALGDDAETVIAGLFHGIRAHDCHTGGSGGLLFTPVVEVAQGGVEVLALRGQPVLDTGRDGVIALPGDDPRIHEFTQLVAEYLMRGTQLFDQLPGPAGMAGQEVEDDGFPLTADDWEGIVGPGVE